MFRLLEAVGILQQEEEKDRAEIPTRRAPERRSAADPEEKVLSFELDDLKAAVGKVSVGRLRREEHAIHLSTSAWPRTTRQGKPAAFGISGSDEQDVACFTSGQELCILSPPSTTGKCWLVSDLPAVAILDISVRERHILLLTADGFVVILRLAMAGIGPNAQAPFLVPEARFEFTKAPRSVLWCPCVENGFLSLGSRSYLWQVSPAKSFASARRPTSSSQGFPTDLKVDEDLIAFAATEVTVPMDASELAHATFTEDGEFLAACGSRMLIIWRLRLQAFGYLEVECLQQRELPDFEVSKLRFIKMGDSASEAGPAEALVAFSGADMLIISFDARSPSPLGDILQRVHLPRGVGDILPARSGESSVFLATVGGNCLVWAAMEVPLRSLQVAQLPFEVSHAHGLTCDSSLEGAALLLSEAGTRCQLACFGGEAVLPRDRSQAEEKSLSDQTPSADISDAQAVSAPSRLASAREEQKELLELARTCMKCWDQSKTRELRKVCRDLPKVSALSKRKLGKATGGAVNSLAAEAEALASEVHAATERTSAAPLKLNSPNVSNQDVLGRAVEIVQRGRMLEEQVEKEVNDWLINTLGKVTTGFGGLQFKRSSDPKEGQIFQDRLLAALRLQLRQDAQLMVGAELRKQLGVHIGEEIKPRLQQLREPLGSALRESTGQLSQAVDTAMREAASSMADERAREAAMRLNSCTNLDDKDHLKDLADAAQSALRPLTSSLPPAAPSHSRNKAGRPRVDESFLLRIRAQLPPLADSFDQLTLEVGKVRSALQGEGAAKNSA